MSGDRNHLGQPIGVAVLEWTGRQFEGIFRQAQVEEGRNRDSAWFSIVDREWPQIKARLEAWLASENFDSEGLQRRRLTRSANESK